MSYPHDVDVYSFGLLNVRHASLDIKVSIENLTNSCELNLNRHVAQYISEIARINDTATDEAHGQVCYSVYELNDLRDYLSNTSGVKIGFPYWCYLEHEKALHKVEKSFVNYIVISIILVMYLFYQLPIESAFHVEDRKIERGYYYKTDSPYGGSVIFRKLIFSGNNKYFAIARIIVLIIVLNILVYILKDKVYASCSCSLELWSDFDWNIFPHAENFIKTNCMHHFLVCYI